VKKGRWEDFLLMSLFKILTKKQAAKGYSTRGICDPSEEVGFSLLASMPHDRFICIPEIYDAERKIGRKKQNARSVLKEGYSRS
jgi:hypothetical protein